MAQQHLYLFVGYPGAGKTTIAQIIAAETGAVHIWADHERQLMFGQPTHSYQESQALYDYLNEATDKLLAAGHNVLFDTNFNFYKDREFLRQIAARYGVETLIIWVTTPKEIAKRRAVQESESGATRLYGNMSEEDFERIAGHLEPPRESEKTVKIDGTKVDPEQVKQLLQ